MFHRTFGAALAGAALLTTLAACAGTERSVAELGAVAPAVEAVAREVPSARDRIDAGTSGSMLPAVDPAQVTGTIISAGSSTVFPLIEAVADQFTREGYRGLITIDSIGTGAGFERFCTAGESDIANASRPIKPEELESCQHLGRYPVEFRVGTDALAVVVSQENDFVRDLTADQLAAVFSGEAEMWSDVDPGWPEQKIRLFTPGTDSGTFDFFTEVVLDKDIAAALRANPQMSEDDNVLAQGVIGSPYAIGYFGFAYYEEYEDALRALAVDGVEPSFATAESGEYTLSRPLFLYTTADIMARKPQVAEFINYFLTNVHSLIREAGYFPAGPDALDAAKNSWLAAVGR